MKRQFLRLFMFVIVFTVGVVFSTSAQTTLPCDEYPAAQGYIDKGTHQANAGEYPQAAASLSC